eukprot:4819261-Prymnesium_polylepis.1
MQPANTGSSLRAAPRRIIASPTFACACRSLRVQIFGDCLATVGVCMLGRMQYLQRQGAPTVETDKLLDERVAALLDDVDATDANSPVTPKP